MCVLLYVHICVHVWWPEINSSVTAKVHLIYSDRVSHWPETQGFNLTDYRLNVTREILSSTGPGNLSPFP